MQFIQVDNKSNKILGAVEYDNDTYLSIKDTADFSMYTKLNASYNFDFTNKEYKYINGNIEEGIRVVPEPSKSQTEVQLEFLGQENTDRELENIAQGQKITDLELKILGLGGTNNVK